MIDYDELMKSILAAKEQMLQHGIKANSVTLNGGKYGELLENLPPNLKPTFFGMAVKADYALPDDCDFLVQHEPPQLITNADRIRTMSDEELAEFLAVCDASRLMRSDTQAVAEEKWRWLDWLRQEVDNAGR